MPETQSAKSWNHNIAASRNAALPFGKTADQDEARFRPARLRTFEKAKPNIGAGVPIHRCRIVAQIALTNVHNDRRATIAKCLLESLGLSLEARWRALFRNPTFFREKAVDLLVAHEIESSAHVREQARPARRPGQHRAEQPMQRFAIMFEDLNGPEIPAA